MRLNTILLPVGALVLALGAGGFSADAAQRDDRGRDRNGRESRGDARPRQSEGSRDAGRPAPQVQAPPQQQAPQRQAEAPRADRGSDRSYDRGGRADNGRYAERDQRRETVPERRDADRGRELERREAPRYNGYRDNDYRRDNYRAYVAPRIIPGRSRHYYGSNGNFSVYFGLGSGYLYGSQYSGRVYGYIGPHNYGSSIYYGDVRLQVRPRDAAVYVDGYYAGIVDDFDGVFQRLTLEVGPHQLEIEAPGLESRFFDVYVDPARTVNIRTDLY